MNEEEKKAIEYTENCLMKITMGIDCEFDVNILDALVNIIKKLQKENEELKDFKKQVTDIESTNFIKYKNYIPIQKIKAKIEELDIAISECIYLDEDDEKYKKAVKKDKLCLLNQKRALQELLDGSDTDVGSIGSEN